MWGKQAFGKSYAQPSRKTSAQQARCEKGRSSPRDDVLKGTRTDDDDEGRFLDIRLHKSFYIYVLLYINKPRQVVRTTVWENLRTRTASALREGAQQSSRRGAKGRSDGRRRGAMF